MPIRDTVETGRPVKIKDEGITLVSNVASIDFIGTSVTGATIGSDVTETFTGGSGGHTIQDEGTPLTARANLNFVGYGVAVTDDSGNDATIVTIPNYRSGAEVDNGNSGASDTIDWSTGNLQKSTITANCTYSFSNPFVGHMTLRIIQDGTGNWIATLPAGKWSSGITPQIKDAAAAWTIVNIYYDGSAYSYSLNQNLF